MKANKYSYLYVLQGFYSMGWEDLSAEEIASGKSWEASKAIKQTRKEYRENEGGTYRIIKRRELNA